MTAATLTLTDFLLARIAEDEAVARNWDSDAECRVASMWVREHSYTTVASAHPGQPWFADGREVDDPQHVVVLFDPARVLAECAAKRVIVGLWQEADKMYGGDVGAYMDNTLRALASVYADHDDFDPAWS